jgi:hypothetical protein
MYVGCSKRGAGGNMVTGKMAMKTFLAAMTILAGLLSPISLSSRQPSCVRAFDFANHAYPYPIADDTDLSRLSPEDLMQLHNGVYRYPGEANPYIGVFLEKVLYVDLTGDGIEEAVVVLGDHEGGSNGYNCLVYVFQCVSGAPQLIYMNDFERAESVAICHRSLVVTAPLWTAADPHCCPKYLVTYEIRYVGPQKPTFRAVETSRKRFPQPVLAK